MASAVTQAGIVPPTIQKARVLDVDLSHYTLTVATEFAKKPLSGISFATPYQHHNNGEGIYFLPEVGSLCWLCEPSDGSMPFVLAWAAGQDEGDFRAKKQDLNPGDIYMGTRDENFLVLRRGGVVQIGGSGLCQRMYMPINNLIQDFCENYALHSLGGDLEWSTSIPQGTTDGSRPSLLTLKARAIASDPNPIATLQIGSHPNDNTTTLSLSILESGAQGAQEQISLRLGNDGSVQWIVQSDTTFDITGKFLVNSTDDASISSQGNATLSGQVSAKVTTKGSATVQGTTGVTLDGPTTAVTKLLTVGGGGQPFALAPALLIWLAAHTHTIILPVPGSPTGPASAAPTGPPPPNIASVLASSAS